MNLLRTFGNRIAGRKKTLDEKFEGLEGVNSLLSNTSETLFEIKYNSTYEIKKEEHVYPEKVISSIYGFMQSHPHTRVECKHTVFSGTDFDKHYLEIKKSRPSDYGINKSVKINYFTDKVKQ